MEIIMPKRKHRIWNTTVAKSFSSCRLVCLPLSIAWCSLLFNTVCIALSHILTLAATYRKETEMRGANERDAFEWYHHAPLSCYSSTTMRHHPHIKYPTRNALCKCTHSAHVWMWQNIEIGKPALHCECKWECTGKLNTPEESSARLAIKLLSGIAFYFVHLCVTVAVAKGTFKKLLAKIMIIRWCCQSTPFQCI